MKKTIKVSRLVYLLFSILVVTACSDKEDIDSVAPVVELLKPVNSDLFLRGGAIVINANVSDNVELRDMEISLATLKAAKGIDTPWTPDVQKIPLSGKEQQIRNIVAFSQIPNDIMSGMYSLSIQVTDMTGNIAKTTVIITIE